MEATIEKISKSLRIYEGILIRISEYLGIHVFDQTIDSNIGSQAVLNSDFVRFLEENASFFKRYHDDYYSSKDPGQIALTINRDKQVVNRYLKKKYPEFFTNDKFDEKFCKKLKYISSYEIDFAIGSSPKVNMNRLGVPIWHLGMKQKMVIDRLNARS